MKTNRIENKMRKSLPDYKEMPVSVKEVRVTDSAIDGNLVTLGSKWYKIAALNMAAKSANGVINVKNLIAIE
jgi:hypothetical protein